MAVSQQDAETASKKAMRNACLDIRVFILWNEGCDQCAECRPVLRFSPAWHSQLSMKKKLAGEATHPDDASEAGDEAGRKTSRLWIARMFLFEFFLLNFKFSLPFWPMAWANIFAKSRMYWIIGNENLTTVRNCPHVLVLFHFRFGIWIGVLYARTKAGSQHLSDVIWCSHVGPMYYYSGIRAMWFPELFASFQVWLSLTGPPQAREAGKESGKETVTGRKVWWFNVSSCSAFVRCAFFAVFFPAGELEFCFEWRWNLYSISVHSNNGFLGISCEAEDAWNGTRGVVRCSWLAAHRWACSSILWRFAWSFAAKCWLLLWSLALKDLRNGCCGARFTFPNLWHAGKA